MPTYKNTSDEDISGIVGVGLIKSGEAKTIADPIDHPSLSLVPDEEATDLQAVEPASEPEVTQAELVDPAPQAAPAPQAQAPVAQPAAPIQYQTPPQQPAAPAAAPQPVQQTNVNGA